MKREIKFRGKSYDGHWLYGFYYKWYRKDKRTLYLSHCIIHEQIAGKEMKSQLVTSESVGQFTGLKDKNGKEIYEGDLLSDPYPIDEDDLSKGYHESLLPVVWCNEQLRWSVDTSFAKDGSFLFSLVEYFGNNLEVKGNVYENSELLK